MTGAEWLGAESASRMVGHLGRAASPRKLRLFGVACCRRIGHLITDEDARRAVDLAERMADGEVPADESRELRERMKARYVSEEPWLAEGREAQVRLWATAAAHGTLQSAEGYREGEKLRPGDADLVRVWSHAASAVGHRYGGSGRLPTPKLDSEHRAQADLLRDVFGNPFRPAAFDPRWQTAAAVRLARRMYDARDFDLMPLLADALEDAGCTDPGILDHCRGDGPHVRGCWVVDVVLDKC